MTAFTAREVAHEAYVQVVNQGRGRVHGAVMADVWAARLRSCRRAEAAIDAAAATPRMFLMEPSDGDLAAMLDAVRERIRHVEARAAAQPTPPPPAPDHDPGRIIGRRTWSHPTGGDDGPPLAQAWDTGGGGDTGPW